MINALSQSNALLKLGLYAQLMLITLWGPLTSCIVVSIVLFIILALHVSYRSIFSPYLALVFCGIIVLIAIPGGTTDDIIQSVDIAIRFLHIILASILLGIIITPHDGLTFCRHLRLPPTITFLLVSMIKLIPLSISAFNSVILAQRSRGFRITFISLFKAETYYALVIPYIVGIVRNAFLLWISLHLRPPQSNILPTRRIKVYEVFILVFSCILWLLPDVSVSLIVSYL